MLFPAQEKVHSELKTILSIHNDTDGAIRPHLHLTGCSGSGKTYLLKTLVEEMNMGLIEINAAGITGEGVSGNSLSKAMRPLRDMWNRNTVIFVDEFDKLFQRNGAETEGFRSLVQDEFLTMLESDKTSVFTDYGKYENFEVKRCLFIFAGAYGGKEIRTMDQIMEAGLRTEFVGRVPLILHADAVPLQQLKDKLTQVDLFKQYVKMMNLRNTTKHVNAIIEIIQKQHKELNIGIRLLNSAIHQHFIGVIRNDNESSKKTG